jgi:lipoprotein-anchoring transpeptidase ErfK/SrfK
MIENSIMTDNRTNKKKTLLSLFTVLVLTGVFLLAGSSVTISGFAGAISGTDTALAKNMPKKNKRVVGPGTCGLDAFNVRQKLSFLKFLPVSKSECIDQKAEQAIIAFQKWQNLNADGRVGPATRKKLYSKKKAPTIKKRGKARRLEINLSKQIMFVVRKNKVKRIISISSGKPGYSTPTGKYQVFRKEQMSWSVPYSVYMPWSSYFNGGIALHQGEVPNYPASHGCVRVPESFAKQVYKFAGFGTQVIVR